MHSWRERWDERLVGLIEEGQSKMGWRSVPWLAPPTVGSGRFVATRMNLDPELQAVVERARLLARERGELRDGPGAPPSEGLSPAVRAAVADWVDSGDYDRAVAELVADDPDLQAR